jgi:hypothetical protein
VKLGDENTKFFHANASITHRNNLISSLLDASDNAVFGHEQKASLLWDDFKERLGRSDNTVMCFDLSQLISNNVDLSSLESPITMAEKVITALPSDKSLGLDGFDNEFFKKCWHIIKQDFYNLGAAFYNSNACLQSINGSFITLIPKIDSPSRVADNRPISLLNTSIKALNKILANRW